MSVSHSDTANLSPMNPAKQALERVSQPTVPSARCYELAKLSKKEDNFTSFSISTLGGFGSIVSRGVSWSVGFCVFREHGHGIPLRIGDACAAFDFDDMIVWVD